MNLHILGGVTQTRALVFPFSVNLSSNRKCPEFKIVFRSQNKLPRWPRATGPFSPGKPQAFELFLTIHQKF
jgi:hypothetical protein